MLKKHPVPLKRLGVFSKYQWHCLAEKIAYYGCESAEGCYNGGVR